MPEEEEILQMLIDLNVSDLQQNRKPEGYNRKGKRPSALSASVRGFNESAGRRGTHWPYPVCWMTTSPLQ